jgi:hypothetical protein
MTDLPTRALLRPLVAPDTPSHLRAALRGLLVADTGLAHARQALAQTPADADDRDDLALVQQTLNRISDRLQKQLWRDLR